jgi:uncharacterized membrane protein YedE/YeeE
MTIAWQHFTLWQSLAGGLMIGLAASLLILLNGRIAGISGILGGLMLRTGKADRAWRWLFLAGLALAVPVWQLLDALPTPTIHASTPLLIISGLLVGVGTRYAAGCTSGHGVCGISRGSPRSLLATASFMAAGFVVVYLMRHAGALAGA